MFKLIKKHIHKESSLNFSIKYKTYSEAFASLIEEADKKHDWYITADRKQAYDLNRHFVSDDIDEVVENVPNIRYGDYKATIGDFDYIIKEGES